MRSLALALIILNLAYLGWAQLIDAPQQSTRLQPASDTSPRLVLASERILTPQSETKKISHSQGPKSTPVEQATLASPKCISVGPFQDLPTVAEASAILKGMGFDSRQHLEQGELWVGHWVSISGFSTHEQAQNAIDRLKEKGVADAYILPGGDPPNVISLGVFKEQERAQRRQNEAKALGLNATIADRTRSGSVYWADVDLPEGKQAFDTTALSSQPGKIVRLEQRPCAPNNG